jgi:hypothetical protein
MIIILTVGVHKRCFNLFYLNILVLSPDMKRNVVAFRNGELILQDYT